MSYIFGPCTITHDTIDQGKTFNGGSLAIVTTERIIETLDGPICDPKALYGTGVINSVELVAGTISADFILTDFGILIFTGEDFVITMPAAKLLWPTELSFGVNSQKSFDLGFFFRPVTGFGSSLITFTST